MKIVYQVICEDHYSFPGCYSLHIIKSNGRSTVKILHKEELEDESISDHIWRALQEEFKRSKDKLYE